MLRLIAKIYAKHQFRFKQEVEAAGSDTWPTGAVATIKGHGIDLAISQKESADYTTNVSEDVYYVDDKPPYGPGDAPKIFIRPKPFNEHVTFHEFLKYVRAIPGERGGANIFFVEDVGYQKAAIQEMERARYCQ